MKRIIFYSIIVFLFMSILNLISFGLMKILKLGFAPELQWFNIHYAFYYPFFYAISCFVLLHFIKLNNNPLPYIILIISSLIYFFGSFEMRGKIVQINFEISNLIEFVYYIFQALDKITLMSGFLIAIVGNCFYQLIILHLSKVVLDKWGDSINTRPCS